MDLSQALSLDLLPIPVLPINIVDEVLRRQTTLLDNLVSEIGGGCHNDRHVDEHRYNPSWRHDDRNKRKSADLTPRSESPRCVRAWHNTKHRDRRESSMKRDE